jgi:hypothetical protein
LCVRGVPGREASKLDMPAGLRDKMVDVVEAPVLLLDRKVNTELRLLECALWLRSGDRIGP